MPANGQASSGYLVSTDTATLLLDCGPGVATALSAVAAPDQLHELRHSAPNCGIRIESAADTMAYTGDTGVTPGLLTLAADADLLLAEATLPVTDDGPHGHLSAADAARTAQAAGVRTLVLTHFPSSDTEWLLARRDEAARAFTGTIHLARPGATFEIREAPP